MNNGGGQPGFGQGPPALCEFKAGRMNFDGRMVTPDRRRGWIRVTRDPLQPGMVTFAYLDEGKTVQESLILFPDIAKFEKVKQSDDRVYLLEIQPEPRRLFFWMQVSVFLECRERACNAVSTIFKSNQLFCNNAYRMTTKRMMPTA